MVFVLSWISFHRTNTIRTQETKAASVDILLFIVDYSPSLVREYMMQVQSTNLNF